MGPPVWKKELRQGFWGEAGFLGRMVGQVLVGPHVGAARTPPTPLRTSCLRRCPSDFLLTRAFLLPL